MKKLLILPILALLLCSCSGGNSPDDKDIIVGASPTPHAQILEVAKPLVEAKGYKLTIKTFDDYVTPNLSLDSGDLDANYFQHTPYLEDFNAKNSTDLVGVLKVHFEPMGIYSQDFTALTIRHLVGAKIAVPNDTSNKERAMNLLNEHFKDNLANFEIIEAEAQSLPALLPDVDYAVINGNYALSSKITDKCIVTESSDSEIAQRNANIIAVKKEYKDKPFVKVLCDAIASDEVRSFIESEFGSSVKVVF